MKHFACLLFNDDDDADDVTKTFDTMISTILNKGYSN
jgi:hypothetical protein